MAKAKPSDTRDAVPFLICRCATYWCALPLVSVVETMRLPPINPLAAMPPFMLGVSIIRGAPVPIVDAARLVGAATPSAPHRVVTMKAGDRRVALAVDAVVGVRAMPAASLDQMPPLLRAVGEEIVSAISTLDTQLLLVLEGARTVPDSVWEAIDSHGVRP
jgi:purine-binding chemotaxis protein CheW